MSTTSDHIAMLRSAIDHVRRQGLGRRDVALIVMGDALFDQITGEATSPAGHALPTQRRPTPDEFMGIRIHRDPQATQIQLIATDGQCFAVRTPHGDRGAASPTAIG